MNAMITTTMPINNYSSPTFGMAPIFPTTPAGCNPLLLLCNETREHEKMTTKMMTMMTPHTTAATMTATEAVQQW